MIIISSNFIPFKGFIAINLFGIIVARRDGLPLTKLILNHEAIHTKQIKELLYVGFYIWYIVEWLVRLIYIRNFKQAYKAISFEKEAFANQENGRYLKSRESFSFLNYMK